MNTPAWPRYQPVADHALLVSFADTITDEAGAAVIALDRMLTSQPPAGLVECVPAFVSLLVDFDPMLTDHATVRAALQRLQASAHATHADAATRHELTVCYEAPFGPDLQAVARASGRSIDEVINHHLDGDYQVRMFGFAPGYAYLAGVPPEIQVPRKPAAVRDVATGSVLVAGPQCLVTTLPMPSGWSIIGRSPARILSRDDEAPLPFGVGDRIRFRRIDLTRFHADAAGQR